MFGFSHPNGSSQLSVTPVPEDLMPSSEPFRCCMHVVHRHIYAICGYYACIRTGRITSPSQLPFLLPAFAPGGDQLPPETIESEDKRHTHMHAHTHTQMCRCTHTHKRAGAHTHTNACARTHTNTRVRTHTHTQMRVCAHVVCTFIVCLLGTIAGCYCLPPGKACLYQFTISISPLALNISGQSHLDPANILGYPPVVPQDLT